MFTVLVQASCDTRALLNLPGDRREAQNEAIDASRVIRGSLNLPGDRWDTQNEAIDGIISWAKNRLPESLDCIYTIKRCEDETAPTDQMLSVRLHVNRNPEPFKIA